MNQIAPLVLVGAVTFALGFLVGRNDRPKALPLVTDPKIQVAGLPSAAPPTKTPKDYTFELLVKCSKMEEELAQTIKIYQDADGLADATIRQSHGKRWGDDAKSLKEWEAIAGWNHPLSDRVRDLISSLLVVRDSAVHDQGDFRMSALSARAAFVHKKVIVLNDLARHH